MKPRVLGLVGPTASGKTALALAAARALRGEIVIMDSMQVYRGMDIGTAKPTPEEQQAVPHHLLDILAPGTPFSVAEYRELALTAMGDVISRGRLPILCGGTGLYLRALSQGLLLGGAPADPSLRARYQQMALEQGNEAVHRVLMEKDPDSAVKLHPNNLRRVIRALEVLEQTGVPFSRQEQTGEASPYDFRLFALTWPRDILYSRIDARVDRMMEEGLLAEVSGLLRQGVSPEAQSMQGLGYKELAGVVAGTRPLEAALEELKRRTRNYAKRQLTWFRADQRVRWLDGHLPQQELLHIITQEMESA